MSTHSPSLRSTSEILRHLAALWSALYRPLSGSSAFSHAKSPSCHKYGKRQPYFLYDHLSLFTLIVLLYKKLNALLSVPFFGANFALTSAIQFSNARNMASTALFVRYSPMRINVLYHGFSLCFLCYFRCVICFFHSIFLHFDKRESVQVFLYVPTLWLLFSLVNYVSTTYKLESRIQFTFIFSLVKV